MSTRTLPRAKPLSFGIIRRILGRRPAREVDAELQMHFEMLVEDYVAQGLTFDAARRAATELVGDVSDARRETVAIDTRMQRRETLVLTWHAFTQDAALAIRMFSREKAWTALAVITLGLGIGANSALFSIVNRVLLRPLPYPEPDRIASITTATGGVDDLSARHSDYGRWKSASKSFSALAASRRGEAVLRVAGQPEVVPGRRVSAGYFSIFGARPLLGRVFRPDEDRPGTPRTVVLSEHLWRGLSGADSSIVGRSIVMDFAPALVVGVMPASFAPERGAEYWEPFGRLNIPDNSTIYVHIVGRLAPGVALDAARAELATLMPRPSDEAREITPVVKTLHDRQFGNTRPTLLVLFAAVGVLLAIASANVANLSLARATRRTREFAVRVAVGASPWRLARFLLAESTLLALVGGIAGLVMASMILGPLTRLLPQPIPSLDAVAIDATVAAFTFGVALLTGIAFGLFPLLQATRADVSSLLVDCGARTTVGIGGAWFRRTLVVAQLATALTLVTGAGLLMKSLYKTMSIDTGLDLSKVLAVRYRSSGVPLSQLAAAASAIPGVESVALADVPPLSGFPSFSMDGADGKPGPAIDVSVVSPSYFKTTGIRLVAGRSFDSTDTPGSEPVAIFNESAARALGKGRPVLGQKTFGGDMERPVVRVVGIARDVMQHGVADSAPAVIYVPVAQAGAERATTLLARVDGDRSRYIRAFRDLHWRTDSAAQMPRISFLEQSLSDFAAPQRYIFGLLAAFAALGALLAMIGLYGVLTYLVAERTNEIGVRVALGADPGRIMRWVLGEGMALVALGLALGLAGSLGGVKLLRTLLYKMDVYDPVIFAAAAALLVITALIACAVPARRAALLDPLDALRS